jgi:hypothetical protein
VIKMPTTYKKFIRTKSNQTRFDGIHLKPERYNLFPHQYDLTAWALRRGRAAIFADTGLGKTRMEIAWADKVHQSTLGQVLMLAPLAVAAQTVQEGIAIGVDITHARESYDIKPGINITNYDRLHKFDTSQFVGVVLDESSIIKHFNSKTLKMLLDKFNDTPYKLCATATPAPNDWTELGNHAEFLGVRSRSEMLAEFFTHDGGETQIWRLKGHARAEFWKWLSSWGAVIRSPADLGHDAKEYDLPPLTVTQHTIDMEHDLSSGSLFAIDAQTLTERRNARRESLVDRVRACAEVVNQSDQKWLIWCDLNAEGDALASAIRDAVQISGSDDNDFKEREMLKFASGKTRVLVSKPSICGFGMNFQVCHNMAFVGVTDSYEAYYQAIRRCWRFGQRHPVHVHVFVSSNEGAVVRNLERKGKIAHEMADAMSLETIQSVKSMVLGNTKEQNEYHPNKPVQLPQFLRAA